MKAWNRPRVGAVSTLAHEERFPMPKMNYWADDDDPGRRIPASVPTHGANRNYVM